MLKWSVWEFRLLYFHFYNFPLRVWVYIWIARRVPANKARIIAANIWDLTGSIFKYSPFTEMQKKLCFLNKSEEECPNNLLCVDAAGDPAWTL